MGSANTWVRLKTRVCIQSVKLWVATTKGLWCRGVSIMQRVGLRIVRC